jgi:hypothetical protein
VLIVASMKVEIKMKIDTRIWISVRWWCMGYGQNCRRIVVAMAMGTGLKGSQRCYTNAGPMRPVTGQTFRSYSHTCSR